MDEYPRQIEELGASIGHWCAALAINHHRATQGMTTVSEPERARIAAALIYERMRDLRAALEAIGYKEEH